MLQNLIILQTLFTIFYNQESSYIIFINIFPIRQYNTCKLLFHLTKYIYIYNISIKILRRSYYVKKITDQDGNIYIQKKPIYKRVWFIVLAAIVLILIIQQTTDNKKKDVEVKNSTQETQKAKYEVSEINIEKDSFSSYVTGVLKNNTDKEKSYVQITIPAYDANGNKVGDALANVNDLKPNSTWKFKAMYIGSEKNVTFKTEELKVSGF